VLAVETERLRFRPLKLEDLAFLQSLYADSRVMELTLFNTLDNAQAEQRLAVMLANQQLASVQKFAIELKPTNQIIGYAGIEPAELEGIRIYEFEQMFSPDRWGRGYASEAARVLLAEQQKLHRLEKVFAIVDAENKASIRVLEKAGMRLVKSSIYGDKAVVIYLSTLF